jgi:hypothetical protein
MANLDIGAAATVILAVSVATERLVTIVKTAVPEWFADERKTDAKEVDLIADRWRRLRVQGVAFLCAWVTTTMLTDGMKPLGQIMINGQPFWTPWLALLASGGSAFWAQVVGYSSALKDVAVTRKALESLAFTQRAREAGATPIDSGRVARGTEDRFQIHVEERLRELRRQPPPATAFISSSGGASVGERARSLHRLHSTPPTAAEFLPNGT